MPEPLSATVMTTWPSPSWKAIGTLLQGSNFGYAYGASLLQTIFDGGKLAGQKDLAEGLQKEFIASYQSAALNAYADVENALVQVADTGKAQNHLTREIEAAREAFQISQLQYRQGAADYSPFCRRSRPCSRPRTSWCKPCWPTASPPSICLRHWAAAGWKIRTTARSSSGTFQSSKMISIRLLPDHFALALVR
jgi:hypothetical protein